ncbi:TonB-dependent receptor [Halioxenophilus sp. WMMB6]|uniref:TonB-dependent receptor n=1 Tax=Halioxenophilus sp. WMMB6 TaxID=3073815 RepID=UPI00295E37B9|nr:TonB-dependent receptor [Halioxenophilus sp. WMMB6]
MKRNQHKPASFVKALLAASIAAAPSVWAETEKYLEEVIVTAEHREVGLQETQISLSAFSDDDINQLGISNGLDIGDYVANLNAQPYVGGRSGVSYNIRGVGNAETLITFDPAVSVYIDGVLIAKNTGSLLDVLELQRVEVLRGPQGTLYGRNTMGGAVNYITKKPTNEFEASVKTTIGSYGQADLRGMINVPIATADSAIGELNMRASAALINRDGIQDNDFPGAAQDELGTKDRDVAMVQLMWAPTEAFSANYSYDRTRIDEEQETAWVTGVRPGSLGDIFGLSAYTAEENDRPDSISVNDAHGTNTDVDGHALTLAWDINENLTLDSITGYRTMENLGMQDSDGTPVSLLATRDLQENESLSQEFRLVGSAMEQQLHFSTGLFYMDEEGDVYNETTILGGSRSNVANYTNEAWAAYGQFTYDITEALDITVGLRYTEETRDMEKVAFASSSFANPVFLNEIRAQYGDQFYPKASRDFDNLSGLVSVSYDWNDDIMSYFKVSSGYQSGGFNVRDTTVEDFTRGFDEETLISYELGTKAQFASRYQFNTALWYSDYDDKRVNNLNPQTLSQTVRNAGVVKIWGLEAEFLAQLTDTIQIGINYGHVDPEYSEYDFLESDGTITDKSDTTNFAYAPENSVNAHIAYEQPLNFGLLRARMDYSYRDEMTFLSAQPERNSSKEAKIMNARVSLEEIQLAGDMNMRVGAWVKNLTDEGYWNFGVNIYDTFGFDINTYGEPRTFGVEVEVLF